jgi:hypothetical protein
MKKLKPHTVDWAQIDRFLASADKKLASAHKILAFDEEACLQQESKEVQGKGKGRERKRRTPEVPKSKRKEICSLTLRPCSGQEGWRYIYT